MIERIHRLERPCSLRLTLSALVHGRRDPSARFDSSGFWRATRSPEGPATMLLKETPSAIEASAWGRGAEWTLDSLPWLLGDHTMPDGQYARAHPVVEDLHRRFPGLRIPRSQAVFEALVPAILEQRVTGMEAKSSYARLIRHLGEPAPGPGNLVLPPEPERLADFPSWSMHPMGIERKRAETLRRVARMAKTLERAATMDFTAARKHLCAVHGVGAWTAAYVALSAIGDPDAVIVGDYHAHDWVAWALGNEARGDDRRMIELLEPFRGQRGRVVRLIEIGHPMPPNFSPRYTPIPIAAY